MAIDWNHWLKCRTLHAGIAKRESDDGLGDIVNLFQRCGGQF